MNQTVSGPILTTEGIPLKVSLKKAERIAIIKSSLLGSIFFIVIQVY